MYGRLSRALAILILKHFLSWVIVTVTRRPLMLYNSQVPPTSIFPSPWGLVLSMWNSDSRSLLIHTHKHTHTCMHAHTHANAHTHTHERALTHTHTHTYTHRRAHTNTHTHFKDTCTHRIQTRTISHSYTDT